MWTHLKKKKSPKSKEKLSDTQITFELYLRKKINLKPKEATDNNIAIMKYQRQLLFFNG